MSLIENHHVILCIGAAIFDSFGITFRIKHSTKKGEKSAIDSVTIRKNKKNEVAALHHVHLWMLTCKRVRSVMQRAFERKESYFPLYHNYPWWCIGRLNSSFQWNTWAYIKHNLLSINKDSESVIYSLWNTNDIRFWKEYDESTQEHRFYFTHEWDPDTETEYARLRIPWRLRLFPPNAEIIRKVTELRRLRNTMLMVQLAAACKQETRRFKRRKTLAAAIENFKV